MLIAVHLEGFQVFNIFYFDPHSAVFGNTLTDFQQPLSANPRKYVPEVLQL